MPRLRGHCRPFLLGALLGASCSASVEPIAVEPECPNMPYRGPAVYENEAQDLLISDFETGNDQLAKAGRRDGAWILGQDFTAVSLTYVATTNCAARGKWAGHFAASGFVSWGANWTAVFRSSSAGVAPYDARGYSAISLWAAFGGDNPTPFPVPVGIVTMDTAWNSSICSASKSCNDHYMTTIPLTREWRRYVVRFQDMTQESSQVAMRQDQFVGFTLWPRQDFDLWIDDVRFEP
jgi:hypothetical protein